MLDEDTLVDNLDKLRNDGLRAVQRFNLEMSRDRINAMNGLAELVTTSAHTEYTDKILKDDGRTVYHKAVAVKAQITRELLNNIPTCRSSDPFVVATDIYRRQAMSEFLMVILADVPGEDDETYQALVARWREEKLKQPIPRGNS